MNFDKPPSPEVNSFERYQNAGGILDETDYANAIAEARGKKTVDPHHLGQAKVMAGVAGIVLKEGAQIDLRVALYDVLRTHKGNPQQTNHFSGKDDQPLFAEVLRMLGDNESLDKFLKAHPNIFPEVK